MAYADKREPRDERPGDLPDTRPPQTTDHSFTLQAIMEIQKSIGGLSEKIGDLEGKIDAQGKKLNQISHIITASGAVLAVLVAVGSFFSDEIRYFVSQVIGATPR